MAGMKGQFKVLNLFNFVRGQHNYCTLLYISKGSIIIKMILDKVLTIFFKLSKLLESGVSQTLLNTITHNVI